VFVPTCHVHRETLAEVQEQVVEIVIAVNPVHISTIENTCNHVAVDQQMVAAGAWAGSGRRIVAESCMDR
jgi:hypothetical protein